MTSLEKLRAVAGPLGLTVAESDDGDHAINLSSGMTVAAYCPDTNSIGVDGSRDGYAFGHDPRDPTDARAIRRAIAAGALQVALGRFFPEDKAAAKALLARILEQA